MRQIELIHTFANETNHNRGHLLTKRHISPFKRQKEPKWLTIRRFGYSYIYYANGREFLQSPRWQEQKRTEKSRSFPPIEIITFHLWFLCCEARESFFYAIMHPAGTLTEVCWWTNTGAFMRKWWSVSIIQHLISL